MPTTETSPTGPTDPPLADLAIEWVDPGGLSPHPANPRRHPPRQLRQLEASIRRFGFWAPVLIDRDGGLICGHARIEAAKRIGLTRVPALRAGELGDAQKRAVMIADNRLAENSEWDERSLAENFKVLSGLGLIFEDESLGFAYGEVEQQMLLIEDEEAQDDEADQLPPVPNEPAVSREGDVWLMQSPIHEELEPHRVACADSTQEAAYTALLGDAGDEQG